MCRTVLWLALVIFPFLCARDVAAAADAKRAGPISLPPSQYFDGDDGWWSSFQIQVGTPPQTVRLFPGTSASAGSTIWVVLAEGCWKANPGLPNCPNVRGYTFTRNESTTWSTQQLSSGGLYALETVEEAYLGLTGSAYYGFDTVNMGIAGQGLPTLPGQLVAGFATDNYWLGSLGLSPLPLNLTNLDSHILSLLGTLRNQSYVPGSSWAYTAGAFYRDPQAYGSLTFGGYDATRQDSKQTLSNIAFRAEDARDLVVQLQTITYDTIGSAPLLTKPIHMFIDSLVSQLWLPIEVCQQFERAFNLTWNANSSLYLIDEHVHSALLAQNPTFTFKIGADTVRETIDIVLPYAAFDLNVTWPITNGPSRYFPLQRANTSQYTLGRVFLQGAYVIADYDRQNFTISQALFPPTSVQQKLVAICAPGNEAACRGPGAALSKGAIAGIVVGAIIILCLFIAGFIWIARNRRKRRRQQAAAIAPSYPVDEKASSDARAQHAPLNVELDGQGPTRYEMDQGNEFRPELGPGKEGPDKYGRHELKRAWDSHELAAGEMVAVELEAPLK
ncbi:hypothetical protein LTR66_004035 [Elasticomyces elasticus]|nr:hypothetical protein LTR66_004035 [Elasticomyces elasticus]KAK5011821.1 hypothetical protein LTR28_012292 [Elasticomyces elasticus]